VFLLTKKALFTPLNSDGDRNIYPIGSPLGFNLLNDFAGMNYMYFGNFTALRPEVIVWRVKMLTEILVRYRVEVFSVAEVGSELENIGSAGACTACTRLSQKHVGGDTGVRAVLLLFSTGQPHHPVRRLTDHPLPRCGRGPGDWTLSYTSSADSFPF
jgi:hypothetical protein